MFFIENKFISLELNYEPRMTVYIPMPKTTSKECKQFKVTFTNKDLKCSQETILALYFASICHAAGHAKVTDFKKYKKWMKGKK